MASWSALWRGAAPGDVPLTIAPHNAFAQNDTVDVVQYINAVVGAPSNSIKVGCTDDVTYHNNNQRTGWNETEQALTPANVRDRRSSGCCRP